MSNPWGRPATDADSGNAQAVRAVTPSPHLRAGSVGLDDGDVSSGVGKLGDVSPRPVQRLLHPIGPVDGKAYSTLARVDEKGASFPGYPGGRTWRNGDETLPLGVTYKEWDVDQRPPKGTSRNADRLVTGSDGSAYYTKDHYESFIAMRGPNKGDLK